MRSSVRRLAKVAALLAGGGFLMAGPNNGCLNYLGESALAATDFCFIFDCQNGIFGGLIDPCGVPALVDVDVRSVPTGPVLLDCP